MKKVPVVKITTPDGAAELAGLSLAATVVMSDVAAALRRGLLAFSTAAGLVMQQMLTDELAAIVGPRHAASARGGSGTGMAARPARSCSVRRRSRADHMNNTPTILTPIRSVPRNTHRSAQRTLHPAKRQVLQVEVARGAPRRASSLGA
jgi:hypothetical protein